LQREATLLDLNLKGRHAVVTGAGRGIGRGIALALAEAGVNVAFNYLHNRRAAEDTLRLLEERNIECFARRANVAEPEAMEKFFQEVGEKFGTLDLLVHNAASGVERPATELTLHHFQWTLEINAWGLLSSAKLAQPLMTSGGSIVAISSLGSIRALPYYAAVGASKAAIESLSRHLATELGSSGIRVNVISAGAIDTDALKHFPNREALLEETVRRTPLHRLTTPEDVAHAVLFLASDLSSGISGATLFVDGGYHVVG
jgi:enoyl-[acyl-carrier protein] reductase III